MPKALKLTLRGETWYLVRRIPKRYEQVEARKRIISISLETDSHRQAWQKAPHVWEAQLEHWQAKLDGRASDARAAFEAVRKVAKGRGFNYLPVTQVATLPDDALLDRIEAISVTDNQVDADETVALMGTAEAPPLLMSELWSEFYKLTADRRLGKSRDQIRKWENPFKRALNRWIAVNGDGALTAIRREDFLSFRSFWVEKIDLEDRSSNTANKDFDKLTNVLHTVIDALGLDFIPPIPKRNWRLTKVDAVSPPPFSSEWIKNRILAAGVLDGLNPEAKAILLICINTGARPSEVATLTPVRMALNANVPHIQIRADGRIVKTKRAIRDIPLVGVALEAAREFPNGFPRYRETPSSLSAIQLKFLRNNGLMESDDHVVYSLRHAFEDRMLKANFPERVKADLMGHDINRERYGAGLSLADTAALLADISF
ncbi:Integrase [Roseovarius sp. EC-HK134]|uniref:tyrosine-type recombinase/integrase n=1 Tax=unclassified Roseovarius TaxID=2614913 RepID=UPI00125A5160|nr:MULTISPECIES: tyrosine-type recombinase/integrase [unclassified Roseovarius]VVT31653.1 Integrase [Roseovarius sp. EC-HK134]VVT32161.1 Integrase [Roseovarius sp. EC-SD190]